MGVPLHRELAPVSDEGWAEMDAEATRTLRHFLSARRLVEFVDLDDWKLDAVGTGRLAPLSPAPAEGVSVAARRAQPMIELCVEFTMERSELDAIDRGAAAPNLDPVKDAARRLAAAEDRLVFHGHEGAGITGVAAGSPHRAIRITDDYSRYPNSVAAAVTELREAGIGGPYGIALGPRCHRGVIETTEKGGYPTLEHLRLILDGPVVWAPEVDGAVVVSLRGGDFRLLCGQDLSLGYVDHDRSQVVCRLIELVTFVNMAPEAALPLRYE